MHRARKRLAQVSSTSPFAQLSLDHRRSFGGGLQREFRSYGVAPLTGHSTTISRLSTFCSVKQGAATEALMPAPRAGVIFILSSLGMIALTQQVAIQNAQYRIRASRTLAAVRHSLICH